jgi:hypothetical protein
VKPSDKSSEKTPQRSSLPTPAASSVSEMLSPSELERLRQNAKEQSDFAREEFGLKEE